MVRTSTAVRDIASPETIVRSKGGSAADVLCAVLLATDGAPVYEKPRI